MKHHYDFRLTILDFRFKIASKRFFSTFIFIIIFMIITFKSKAQSQWETIDFPWQEYSQLTCAAVTGDEIYTGTVSSGVFYSSNKGRSWTPTNDTIGIEEVHRIIISIDNIVWVQCGDYGLYWTSRKGETWNDVSYFRRNGKTISCLAVNRYGHIYAGTGDGVYKSDDLGNTWTSITNELSVWAVHTIGIKNLDIFISIEGLATGFYHTDSDGETWKQVNSGLPTNPTTNDFLFSSRGRIYASIQGNLYYTENKGMSWTRLTEDLEKIYEMLIDSKDNLVVYDGGEIKFYSEEKDKWAADPDRLSVEKARQMVLDDDYLIVVMDKNILKTVSKIEIIVAELLWFWEISVLDHSNQPVRNKEFELYKMYGSNQHSMGKVTTDNYGKFTITGKDFTFGNGVKIERIVYTKPSVKGNHQDVNNMAYRIKIDNASFDTLGKWQYDTLTSATALTTKLCHTTVMFSLIFGVEWEAKPEYLVGLQEWLKKMNNYLYDVYDGQLYLEHAAIFDNQKYWKDVDMHIWASNMVWPNAFLDGITVQQGKKAHFPRKWYGNSNASRNLSTITNWLDFASDYMWTTIAHEFGHYALGFDDEYTYTDTNKAKLLPVNYNYGYMDFQYPGGGEWSSELSNATRYPNDDYKITGQWFTNKTDCWSDFEKMYEGTYDGIFCPVFKPSERNNLDGRNYFIGPNDNFIVNSDVSYWLDSQIFDDNNNAGDFSVICKKVENNKDVPLPNTNIFLLKSNGYINQGKTDDNAKSLILGANVGDFGYATYSDYMNFTSYISKFQINNVSGQKPGNEDIMSDYETMLTKIDGQFPFVSQIDFDDSGYLHLRNYTSSTLTKLPVEYYDSKDNLIAILSNKANEFNWDAIFTESLNDNNLIRMNLEDNANQDFSIFLQYQILEPGNKIISKDGVFAVSFSEPNPDLMKLAVLSSDFLASMNGLPPKTIQAGSTYSIAHYPRVNSGSNNYITLNYSDADLIGGKEDNLRLYIWNIDEWKWEEMRCWVDTANNVVQSDFRQFGTYGLFIHNPETGVHENEQGSLDFEITPNPTEGNARLRLNITSQTLTASQSLTFRIYDIFGREIEKSLVIGHWPLPEQVYELNLSVLPAGVYICRVETAAGVIVKKIVKM